MLTRLFFLSTCVFIFFSCSEEVRVGKQKLYKGSQPFLFQMQFMFSESEDNMSFPLWFDKEVVVKHKIKTIRRCVYPLISSSTLGSPKEIRTYVFDETGRVVEVKIEKFYENVQVEDLVFSYPKGTDEYGYANAIMKKGVNQLDEPEAFLLFEKERYSDKFLVYRNAVQGDYLFYMLDKNSWGALSVDSLLNPIESDLIVLGTPAEPKKIYNVKNTVEEANVVRYNYERKAGLTGQIERSRYPFFSTRTIDYDENGYCVGFIDSTFASNEFLSRKSCSFEFDTLNLPSKLVTGLSEGDFCELYTYDFFE